MTRKTLVFSALFGVGVLGGAVALAFAAGTQPTSLPASQNLASYPASPKGMTWIHKVSNAVTGTITVGCDSTSSTPCDPYHGDTMCAEKLPVLCIHKPNQPFQLPTNVDNSSQYNLWSGGVVATTEAVPGNMFPTLARVNSFCKAHFGNGWRVAEFHDGWGWNFQAYGGTVSAPTVPSARFWVHINDQTATCWTHPQA